jgi:hypothetical protein
MEYLSKGKQELLKYLGRPYGTKVIDGENCVYLKLGKYDIEIARGRTVRSPFDIYVWRIEDGLEIVERHMGIKSDYAKIKELLDDIRRRYKDNKYIPPEASDHLRNIILENTEVKAEN